MNELTLLRDAGPEAPALTPAARSAARAALLAEIESSRTVPGRLRRRLPDRKVTLRLGAAVVAVAAAWTTAVVVSPRDTTRPPATRTATPTHRIAANGITLVAAEAVTVPLSLDHVPPGLTPTFSRFGGHTPFGEQPVGFRADYRSADGAGFTLWSSAEDPRKQEGFDSPQPVTEHSTVLVGGVQAELGRGEYATPRCSDGPATPQQAQPPAEVCHRSFADLIWQRHDGQWVWIEAQDAYSAPASIVAVGESIVDRPQPVPLRVHLAPAGWSVSAYEDNQHIGLASDTDPDQLMGVDLLARWRRETIETPFEGKELRSPVTSETVNGHAARLAVVDGQPRNYDFWWLTGQLPDGTLFLLQAPASLTREQLLEIAGHITYTP